MKASPLSQGAAKPQLYCAHVHLTLLQSEALPPLCYLPFLQSCDSKFTQGWSKHHVCPSSKSYDRRESLVKSEKSDSHQWDGDSSKQSAESRPLETGMLRSCS